MQRKRATRRCGPAWPFGFNAGRDLLPAERIVSGQPELANRKLDAAADLKKKTLTNLYNQRPTWLDLAHKKLDAAVFAAYGWDPVMTDEYILAKLLEFELGAC